MFLSFVSQSHVQMLPSYTARRTHGTSVQSTQESHQLIERRLLPFFISFVTLMSFFYTERWQGHQTETGHTPLLPDLEMKCWGP